MGSGRLDVLKEVNLKGAGHPHVPKDYPLEKRLAWVNRALSGTSHNRES